MKFKGKFIEDITCRAALADLSYDQQLFDWYDKDGFDLTVLEQRLYKTRFSLQHILNRDMLAVQWVVFDDSIPSNIYIDHAMLLMRCDVQDTALQQIRECSKEDRRLIYLCNTRKKWGVDIDINWMAEDDNPYEVIHLEYDTYDYDEACEIQYNLEEYFRDADLENMAEKIIKAKDHWQHLNGLKQNDWKAQFFGFSIAEDTKKSY